MPQQRANLLRQAELLEVLNLEGKNDIASLMNLIKNIISVLAKDSPVDHLRKEVELFNAAHNCYRKDGQLLLDFAAAYVGAFACYVRQLGPVDSKGSRQIATLMIKIPVSLLTPSPQSDFRLHPKQHFEKLQL